MFLIPYLLIQLRWVLAGLMSLCSSLWCKVGGSLASRNCTSLFVWFLVNLEGSKYECGCKTCAPSPTPTSPVVLCRDWKLTMPESITAVRGSCVTVPCVFEVPSDQEANLLNCPNGGVWRKRTIRESKIIFTNINSIKQVGHLSFL